jgi:hypothetical protein
MRRGNLFGGAPCVRPRAGNGLQSFDDGSSNRIRDGGIEDAIGRTFMT